MRVALIHDWLTGMRGGEKVLEMLCMLFPQADIYTLVYIPQKISPLINTMNIKTSILQHMPRIERNYRYYLPLMPYAIERFNLVDYDLIISSSHCVAKGIRFGKGIPHICYCHTPMRYVWDLYQDYFGSAQLKTKMAIKLFLKYLRKWDINSSKKVDYFIANSKTVQERIRRIYNRESNVINPPVDTDTFYYRENEQKSDYFLFVGAFAAYKRVDLIVNVFNAIDEKVVIIGDGQEFEKIKAKAKKNIIFLGWVSNTELRHYYAKARALIFPAYEDFGIVPLEAMACGTPVIAFNKGGATETVIENKTGIFFEEQEVTSLINVIKRFNTILFDRIVLRDHAQQFCNKVFSMRIEEFVKKAMQNKKKVA